MLNELRISNLGVIANAELHFGPGFNVLTGETGAGKTMILNALLQTLGEKSDSTLIRESTSKLKVESIWELNPSQLLEFEKLEIADEIDSELVLGKSIDVTGKARVFVNGMTSTNSKVVQLAECLILVFGQSDQRYLLQPQWQIRTLDIFCGQEHITMLNDYRQFTVKYRELRKEISQMNDAATDWERNLKLLAQDLQEFDQIDPLPNEDEEILKQISEQEKRAATSEYLDAISKLFSNEEGVSLSDHLRDLGSLISRAPNLEQYSLAVDSLLATLNELESEVISSLSEIMDGPKLEDLYARKAQLLNLMRKHGAPLGEIITNMKKSREIIHSNTDPKEKIAKLELELAQTAKKMRDLAEELSNTRIKRAKELQELVTKELSELKMLGIKFIVEVDLLQRATEIDLDGRIFDGNGVNSVEFKIAFGDNPARSIAKSASGGELSRLMLALQVVIQDSSSNLTYVFDEVDAGIGGETAIEVGRRLAKLALNKQVLVVTHLPQVAAFADHHFSIKGDLATGIKTADVQLLSESEREKEIARMLGGMKDSTAAVEHARELLALRH